MTNVMLIALTGCGRPANRQAAMEAGFDPHLVKPLNPAGLYALIFQRCASQGSIAGGTFLAASCIHGCRRAVSCCSNNPRKRNATLPNRADRSFFS